MTDRFLNDTSGIKLYFCSSGANCHELEPLHLQGSQIRAHPPNCRVESDSEIGSHFITGFCHQFNGSHSIRPKLPSTHPTVRQLGQLGFCKRLVCLQPHHEVHAIQLICQYPIQDLFECIHTIFTPRNRSCIFKFTKILKPRNVRTKQMLFNRASKCQTSKCI